MKILIIANYDEGLYKFRKEVIEYFVKNNEIVVSVPGGEYIDLIRELGVKVIETEFNRKGTNPVKDIGLLRKYISIIRSEKPDMVLTYTIKPNVYGGIACRLCKVPYIPNITGLGSVLENENPIQKLIIGLYKTGLKDASTVFFQNAANRDFMLTKNIVKGNYQLIPGSGVNLDRFVVKEYPNNDVFRFVFVGRIMKEKGIEEYLEAAKYFYNADVKTEFNVCGFYEENYKDVIEDLNAKGIINYRGVVKDMSTLYSEMHATVLPTFYPEGLSNVLLESLASGRPIITTNRPGCREVIDDGINGFVVKEKDKDDLIKAIDKFISLDRNIKKQMGLEGRKKVENHFSRNIVISEYERAINNVRK